MTSSTRKSAAEAEPGALARRCLNVLASHPDKSLALEILETLYRDHLENRPPGPLGSVWCETSRVLTARKPVAQPGQPRTENKPGPQSGRDFLRIISVLQRRLQTEDNASLRSRLFWQLIKIYEKNLGWRKTAFQAAARAFRENIQDDDLRQKLEWLARQAGNLGELTRIYRQVLAGNPPRACSLIIRRRLAELYRTLGRSSDLTGVLMQLAMLERMPKRRRRLLKELASLSTITIEKQDFTLAFLACCRAYQEKPTSLGIRLTLGWLAQKTDSLEELNMLLEDGR